MNPEGGMGGVKEGEVERGNGDSRDMKRNFKKKKQTLIFREHYFGLGAFLRTFSVRGRTPGWESVSQCSNPRKEQSQDLDLDNLIRTSIYSTLPQRIFYVSVFHNLLLQKDD